MNTNFIRISLIMMLLLASVGTACAHFTMVFPSDSENTLWDVTPEDYIADLGETKTIYMMWGHPYEHILFDMASVPEVSVMKPDGTVEILETSEINVEGMDEDGNDGTFVAYMASFTVDQHGDSVIFVKYEDEDENLIDYTKAVIHCGEEMWYGWDAEVGQQTEILPLMRPYGMEEGFVFAGQAMYDGNPLTGAPVEVEIYHTLELGKEIVAEAESMYPFDPPMVFTRLTKSNDQGEFVYSLDEPGIWFVGATMEPETGRNIRGVFIVPIIESFPPDRFLSTTSRAELEQASSEVKQAVNETKEAIGDAQQDSPGFGMILSIFGLIAALLIVMKKK
jgi:cobalt/nickel transport protein